MWSQRHASRRMPSPAAVAATAEKKSEAVPGKALSDEKEKKEVTGTKRKLDETTRTERREKAAAAAEKRAKKGHKRKKAKVSSISRQRRCMLKWNTSC